MIFLLCDARARSGEFVQACICARTERHNECHATIQRPGSSVYTNMALFIFEKEFFFRERKRKCQKHFDLKKINPLIPQSYKHKILNHSIYSNKIVILFIIQKNKLGQVTLF